MLWLTVIDYVFMSTALVVYEYLITFGREVELYWTQGVTAASILFYANRYISLAINVYQLFENLPVGDLKVRLVE